MSLKKICINCTFGIKNDIIEYGTKINEDIFAPMEGKVKEVNDNSITLKHNPDGCNSFVTIITNIKPNDFEKDDKVDGKIGQAKGAVTLSVQQGFSIVDPRPYFDGTYCKKETKKENEKEREKTTSNTDITYDPYAIAAAPFYAMKLGKAGFKKLFTEEINRIKNLMK